MGRKNNKEDYSISFLIKKAYFSVELFAFDYSRMVVDGSTFSFWKTFMYKLVCFLDASKAN